jgi:hypothetical protein
VSKSDPWNRQPAVALRQDLAAGMLHRNMAAAAQTARL